MTSEILLKASSPQTRRDIDALHTCTTVQEAREAYVSLLPRYGFTHVIMGHVVNPFMHPMEYMNSIQTNWDPAWLAEWMSKRYFFHDAVALEAMRTEEPFTWDDAVANGGITARKIARRAKDFGLVYGLAIPVMRRTKPRGCVSLSTADKAMLPADWSQITALSRAAFLHLESLQGNLPFDDRPSLTDREIEILYLVAAGKTNWEAGQMLQISQHSVRDHLKAVSQKLKTANRAHSVARAIQLGAIVP